MKEESNLSKRLLKFTVDVIMFLRKLPFNEEYKVIRHKLIKSSSSSGAYYEEAQSNSSDLSNNNEMIVSIKKMHESNYWLRVIKGIKEKNDIKLEELIKESMELKLILSKQE